MLALLLVIPLITAAIPGRSAPQFAEMVAWASSPRAFAIPLFGRLQLNDLGLAILALFTVLTAWQVLVLGSGRPRLSVAQGPLPQLSTEEQAIVETLGHAQARRRPLTFALFAVRLAQFYNPVAMWAFREYRLEVHAECDAEATAGHDPHILARFLLKTYASIPRHDGSTRNLLRRRVDVLLAGGPHNDAIPIVTVVAIGVVFLVVLPWIV